MECRNIRHSHTICITEDSVLFEWEGFSACGEDVSIKS